MNRAEQEQMNVVIVGHVDHGKSTVIGRLLADTDALPRGKLQAVKDHCKRNAKPFEYAFLLDALKDEQSQGITIDTARCFFKSAKRDYIIIDAPGHIEFLKNMVTGAARAEAAVLVIDAKEGIRENSKRHGYMLSFLGIRNIAVCINKMDLVDYDREVYEQIKTDYLAFLEEINIQPQCVIPISARDGENITVRSEKTPWYDGDPVLQALDRFQKARPDFQQPLRFPVQDVYKFTAAGDDRRIIAGRMETGVVKTGDGVVFYPSHKRSRVTSVERFSAPAKDAAVAGECPGFCLETQIYLRPGEIMCKAGETGPHVSSRLKVNVFWMGKRPMVKGRTYKLKISTQQVPVVLTDILSVLDASELSSISSKPMIDRHDVAECILETLKPVAFDDVSRISQTSRFVIVDHYEITGGGIILSPVYEEKSFMNDYIRKRNHAWTRSEINPDHRASRNKHTPAFIVLTGQAETGKLRIARALEKELFDSGRKAYFLGVSNDVLQVTQSNDRTLERLQYIRSMGEIAHVLADAGHLFISSITDTDEYELKMLMTLTHPHKVIVVNVGEALFPDALIDIQIQANEQTDTAVGEIKKLLHRKTALDPEYTI